jgi:hypothetical protein
MKSMAACISSVGCPEPAACNACGECAFTAKVYVLPSETAQESAARPRAERNDRAPICEWLLDYVDLMEKDLKQHANPVGLHRAVKNRQLQRRIAEVIAHVGKEGS